MASYVVKNRQTDFGVYVCCHRWVVVWWVQDGYQFYSLLHINHLVGNVNIPKKTRKKTYLLLFQNTKASAEANTTVVHPVKMTTDNGTPGDSAISLMLLINYMLECALILLLLLNVCSLVKSTTSRLRNGDDPKRKCENRAWRRRIESNESNPLTASM